ncbi:MAG: hypothetical protein QOI24_604 [Acidobacteriota bacterium]|jgi:hypothetical protein|nr:hypothetical protein [Acidobacteriota bacterium]
MQVVSVWIAGPANSGVVKAAAGFPAADSELKMAIC